MRKNHKKPDQASLGLFLKQKRIESGLSQVELSEKLGYSSGQFVSNWERGACSPPMTSLADIIKILNIDAKTITDIIMDQTLRDLNNALKRNSKAK